VKNLANVLASIGALVDDEDLVVVTWMVLENIIASFVLQLQFEKRFPISKI
jgi:hypothetical protein